MTSSLVGSEMCIRDSSSNRPSKSMMLRQQLMPGRPGKRPTCVSSRTWRPVSYTHLTLPTICSV
eukprot:4859200-Prorocentrum_lima.AAC.1